MTYRRKFTMLDCLAVVGCVIVVLLIMPAFLIDQRGPLRRNQCATQLKNFALAAVLYESIHQHLPGFLNDYGYFEVNDARHAQYPELKPENLRTHRKIGSWAVALLPHLDAQPTYEVWVESRYSIIALGTSQEDVSPAGYLSVAAPNLAIFRCPNDPVDDGDFGSNSYICNAGMYHRNHAGADQWTLSRLGSPPVSMSLAQSMTVANGAFNNQVACIDRAGDPVAVGPQVRFADFSDGLGNTVLFSESVQAMPWHRIGFATAADLVVQSPTDPIRYPEAARYVSGMTWHYEDDEGLGGAPPVKPVHRINGGFGGVNGGFFMAVMSADKAGDLARPSSAHAKGVNFGLADGSIRFISESIDYRVYQALLTPDGRHSDVPFPEFVFADVEF